MSDKGRNILHWAVLQNRKDIVSKILTSHAVQPGLFEQVDSSGNTSLFIALQRGRFDIAELMLNHEACTKKALPAIASKRTQLVIKRTASRANTSLLALLQKHEYTDRSATSTPHARLHLGAACSR